MINPNRAGLVTASLVSGWHVVWLSLVLAHWAQPVLDFVFWAHMLRPVYFVTAFDPVAAVTLIAITFISGYVFGYLGGLLWNKLHLNSQQHPH